MAKIDRAKLKTAVDKWAKANKAEVTEQDGASFAATGKRRIEIRPEKSWVYLIDHSSGLSTSIEDLDHLPDAIERIKEK